ncbi:MAG: ferritin family protein [Candidatus Scalindua sp.]
MTKRDTSEAMALVQILEESIERERNSYDYYAKAARQSGKPSVKRMFLRLAEMEKGHFAELSKQLDYVQAQIIVDSAITGGC